jgi:hypothetical protein
MKLLRAKIALRVAQIIDGVEQVGLPAAIGARDAGNGLRKAVFSMPVIAELGKRYLGKGAQALQRTAFALFGCQDAKE